MVYDKFFDKQADRKTRLPVIKNVKCLEICGGGTSMFILIGSIAMLLAMMLYIQLLLAVASVLSGILKFVASMLIYLVFVPVFVSPLFYILKFCSNHEPFISITVPTQ